MDNHRVIFIIVSAALNKERVFSNCEQCDLHLLFSFLAFLGALFFKASPPGNDKI